jgi:MFS family permease
VTDRAPQTARTGAWTPGQRLLTAGLVSLVTAGAFEGLAVPTVLPATLAELRGLELYGWAFSGFWLSSLVGIALAGAEADRRGPVAPLLFGVVAFAVGLVVAGSAPSMGWVVAGRVVQGLGAGAIAAITYVAIARGYPPAAQPRMIAVISSAWVLPGVVGPALAGWISQELSWRWAFIALAPLVPIAAVAVAIPLSRLPAVSGDGERAEARGEPRLGAPRWPRTVGDPLALAVGAGALLAAPGWGSAPAAAVLAAVGILIAWRPLRRLLPAGTLTASTRRGAAVATLALVSVAFFGAEAFVPLAVASVRNAGTVAGGLALTSAALTWTAGSWIQARLAGRRSRASVTLAGLALIGAGILLVAGVPGTGAPPVALATAAWAVAGLGMGLAYSTTTLVVIESATPGSEGAASASVQLANTLGIALGTGAAGALVAWGAAGPVGLAGSILLADALMLVVVVVSIAAARRMADAPVDPAGATASMAGGTPPAQRGPGLGP